MIASQIIERLRRRGVRVFAKDGDTGTATMIGFEPARLVSPELLALLKAKRTPVLELLAPTPLSLVDDEYRAVIRAAVRDARAGTMTGTFSLAPGHTVTDPSAFVLALLERVQGDNERLATGHGSDRRRAVESRLEGYSRDLEAVAFWWNDAADAQTGV